MHRKKRVEVNPLHLGHPLFSSPSRKFLSFIRRIRRIATSRMPPRQPTRLGLFFWVLLCLVAARPAQAQFAWSGSAPATNSVGNGGTLSIQNSTDHDYSGIAITNNGTVTWTGGRLRSGGGGSFVNNGTFNDQLAGSTDINDDFGGGATFTNSSGAVFAKSGN